MTKSDMVVRRAEDDHGKMWMRKRDKKKKKKDQRKREK